MRSIIQALKNNIAKDIVVIGDVMLDEYVHGSVDRISPEAPVPVLREEHYECSFGGAANVAANCKHIGCNVSLIGIVGMNDDEGKSLISMLADKKINTDGIVRSADRGTTSKMRIVSQGQQLLRIDDEDTRVLNEVEKDALACNIHTIIKSGSTVVISDYSKGLIDRSVIKEIIARATHCGSCIIVDPKGPDFEKYKGVHYIKPNLKEFGQMVSCFKLSLDDSLVENARRICQILSLQGLIVTMGEKGMHFITSDRDTFYAAHRQEVYDVTGAGDTVLAFLSTGIANGLPFESSLNLANKAASIAVSHHKAYAVGLDELLDEDVETTDKVFWKWDRLKRELDFLKNEKNKKVVFTNGCFDLLHSGHIYLLQEAKKRGDILVVALNTDESVRRFKGENRPIKTLTERVNIIAAIDVVDYVVTFDENTPYKLIDYLKPNVLVKGGDYKIEDIAGYDVVTEGGGSVEVVNYKIGLSTSSLVQAARRV